MNLSSGLTTTVLCATALLACVGCPTNSDLPPPIDIGSSRQAAYLGVELGEPAGIAATSDGRVFFTERTTGRVRVVRNGSLRADPVLEVPVDYAGEWGLLGITLDPRFNTNGRLYVFYTRSDIGEVTNDPRAALDHRVVYVEVDDNTDVAISGEIFVASLPLGTTGVRVGGAIAFGRDGFLYVGVGDGGDADLAQTGVLQGKILRFNSDGTIPEDNPSPDSPIFARGVAEPRALAVDPESFNIFLLDRGGGELWEIDILRANANYGWPVVGGFVNTSGEREFADLTPEYVDPINELVGIYSGLAVNPSTKYGLPTRTDLFTALDTEGTLEARGLATDRNSFDGELTTFGRRLPTPIRALYFTPAGTLYVAAADAVLRILP